MPGRERSPSSLVLLGTFVAVFVIGVAALTLGAPDGPVVLVVAGLGVALVMKTLADRRFEQAEAIDPGGLDAYPLRYPAERWPVGAAWQVRLLPSVRKGWSPGILGVGFDAVRFVPSKAEKAHLAWSARPTSVEVTSLAQVCTVRVHTPDGSAQFSIQQPATVVRGQLAPMLPLTDA